MRKIITEVAAEKDDARGTQTGKCKRTKQRWLKRHQLPGLAKSFNKEKINLEPLIEPAETSWIRLNNDFDANKSTNAIIELIDDEDGVAVITWKHFTLEST